MSDPKQQHDTSNEAPGFFDKERNVSIILRVFYGLCAVLVILDFVVHRHIYTDFERIPAFYAIYGFVACVVLVIVAKEMRKIFMRDEDYYEPPEAEIAEVKEGDN